MTLTWIIKMRMSQSTQLGVSALFQTVIKESKEDPLALQMFLIHAIWDVIPKTAASWLINQSVASRKVQKLSKHFSSTCSQNIIKLRSTSSPKTSLIIPYHPYPKSNPFKVKLQGNKDQCFHRTLCKNQGNMYHICNRIHRNHKCKYINRCNGLSSIRTRCLKGSLIRLLCRHLICIWQQTCHHPKWDTTDLRCTTATTSS